MRTAVSQIVTLGGLAVIWFLSAGLSGILLGGEPNPAIVATAIIFVLAIVSAAASGSWPPVFGLSLVALFAFLFSLLIPFIQLFFRYTLWNPVVSLVDYAETVPYVASAVLVGLAGLLVAGILYTGWKTGPAVDWSLILKMVACPLVLVVLLGGFLIVVWRTIEILIEISLFMLGVGLDTRILIGRVVTFGVLALFIALEFRRIGTIERHGNTDRVTPDKYPNLHSITTKIASQLDVPKPTIAISKRSEPEAITVGYRPENITLILSQGLFEVLNDEEVEAVIAHELAHVANLDAMVTTVASLPVFFADGLQNRMNRWIDTDDDSLILGTFLAIGAITEYISRPVVSVLLRARETAADRTAAMVTGSPADLASALRTLDKQIDATASEDLREASGLSSLSVLPLDPFDTDESIRESDGAMGFTTLLIPDGWESVGVVGAITSGLMWIKWRLFATHPSTVRRIDALDALSEKD